MLGPDVWSTITVPMSYMYRPTSADASDSFVQEEVAVETLLFVALVLVVAEVSLLSGAHLAALATVLDDVDAALAAEGIVRFRAFARIVALRSHLQGNTNNNTMPS